MGDGGLALGAAVARGGRRGRRRSARPRSPRPRARLTMRPDIEASVRAAGLRAEPRRQPAGPRAPTAGGRPDRHVVPGRDGVRPARARAPQRAGAARSARHSRSPQSGAQAARLVPAVLPEHARERGRGGCSRTGMAGATASMTMAYQVAERVPLPDGRSDERGRHVPPADRRRRRRGAVRATCCGRRAGDGAPASCSIPASTFTASRWCARRPRRWTSFSGRGRTRWRSVPFLVDRPA